MPSRLLAIVSCVVNAGVAERGQPRRMTLAREHGADNSRTGLATSDGSATCRSTSG